ncbi:MAG TPA: DUF1329 domain-containing protein, partial [Candidatus Binatia bacterium]|nr:DUF1329 domain-containing protein [Candidatus Binatia bacterium]
MRATIIVTGAVLALAGSAALARVTPEEAAHLGQDLTPIGAQKAGNADGSVPEWKPWPKDNSPLSGEYPHNPDFDAEKPLFVITAQNLAQYAGKLTVGHQELLKRYPQTYRVRVFPSHRTAAFPEPIYKATFANATTADLPTPDTPQNATLGFPFPIPKSGAEPIWNHKLKWRGENVRRYNNQMIVGTDGKYTLTKLIEDVKFY